VAVILACMTGHSTFKGSKWSGFLWGDGGFKSKEDGQMRSMMNESESMLQTGNYIVYEYYGTHLKDNIILKEEIVEKTGLRLTIKVTVQRGEQIKTWYQVVIDSIENRKSNAVEELYQIINGDKKILNGNKEEAILSLYEWVLPPHGKRIGDAAIIAEDILLPRNIIIPGECTLDSQIIEDRIADTKYCVSSHFPWYHISYIMTWTENPEVLFAMTISDWGP
jgi:hypothetical protein